MELPEYLNNIKVERTSPPVSNSSKDLPFHELNPDIFEKFCCELLIRKTEIEQREEVVRIMPIGIQGQKQFGSDIFVMDESSGDKIYSLYEVKRVKKYTKSDFEKSVKRFLENHKNWNFKISSFFIFTSQNISADQISLWQTDAKKLSTLNVNYTVLTPSSYKRWLTDKPELVYAYFGDAWVELLYGKIGLWHLQKYGIYKFEESKSWINYEKEDLFIGDDDLHYINDHIKVNCYMPSLVRRHISCFFELRNGRFSHVMITLNNHDFLSRYFHGVNTPLKTRIRKFITPHYKDPKQYILDIGNCRVIVSEEEAECACTAFDVIWDDYKNRIQKIEDILKTKYFAPVPNFSNQVVLMRIKCWLWRIIKEFTDNHSCIDGSGDWNIFQYSSHAIKVFTPHDTKHLANGEHCTLLTASYDPPFGYPGNVRDEIVILWQYPFNIYSDGLEEISPRYHWDAKTAHDWLRDELIPQALSWHDKRSSDNSLTNNIKEKFFPKIIEYNHEDYLISNFKPILGDENDWEKEGTFLKFVENLQLFYNSSPDAIYLDPIAQSNLFAALYLILKHSCSTDFGYINGNLNYLRAKNMEELLDAVYKQSTSKDQYCDNPFKIDCILRSMIACIRDGSNLNQTEIANVVKYLEPLTSFANTQKMLTRQKTSSTLSGY